ncbi:MAG: NifU family protein [Atopobiaceae bacterium]|nr:NifU family protein [Olsenella sp.]MBQ6492134.1 NifU family protein [Atopobiaceae bacterium]
MADEATPTNHINAALLEATLDAIRPSLQADGGDCELVDFDSDGVVSVRLTGACNGCPLSSITLSAGIERILKEHVPGVESVQAVM